MPFIPIKLPCFLTLTITLFLTACVGSSSKVRHQHADTLASRAGWEMLKLPTNSFTLTAYAPLKKAAPSDKGELTIYIEGDGQAWLTRNRPSLDPSPRRPLALELALRHPEGNAAYLARPCQYTRATDFTPCKQDYWTNQRFAPEVITASDDAINQLKTRFGASRLTLVGYSGGGAVAALVAARRTDVTRLITLAGNLDHEQWTRQHNISPLSGSLNPVSEWSKLLTLPQLHFVGGDDPIITRDVADAFRARFPVEHQPQVKVIPDFTHSCCWVERWPELVALWPEQ